MNNQEDVDVLLGGQASQGIHNLVLEVELLVALSLVTQHELKVIDADHLNIVSENGVL